MTGADSLARGLGTDQKSTYNLCSHLRRFMADLNRAGIGLVAEALLSGRPLEPAERNSPSNQRGQS